MDHGAELCTRAVLRGVVGRADGHTFMSHSWPSGTGICIGRAALSHEVTQGPGLCAPVGPTAGLSRPQREAQGQELPPEPRPGPGPPAVVRQGRGKDFRPGAVPSGQPADALSRAREARLTDAASEMGQRHGLLPRCTGPGGRAAGRRAPPGASRLRG